MWFATAFVIVLAIAQLILFATIKINHLIEKNKEKKKTNATVKDDPKGKNKEKIKETNATVNDDPKEKNKEKIKETSATTATTKEDQVDAFIQTCDLSQKQDKSTFLSYLYGFFPGRGNCDNALWYSFTVRFEEPVLCLSEEETTDGMHDLHDSVKSLKVWMLPDREKEWIPYTKAVEDDWSVSVRLLRYFAGCDEIFVKNKNPWEKSAYYQCTGCPGSADFCVHNPPGLTGWFMFRYTCLWD